MMFNPRRRRWARRFALQALYQYHITQQNMSDIIDQFMKESDIKHVDIEYFKELAQGAVKNTDGITEYIQRYIDRKITEIDPVELSILRISIYELLKRVEIPYRVILNEALELGKLFGATDGYKFVNGILDKVAHECRHLEVMQK